MKKIGSLIILLVGLVLKSYAQAPAKDAVVGEWLSENKDGKVLIFKQGDKFFGKISW